LRGVQPPHTDTASMVPNARGYDGCSEGGVVTT